MTLGVGNWRRVQQPRRQEKMTSATEKSAPGTEADDIVRRVSSSGPRCLIASSRESPLHLVKTHRNSIEVRT